MSVLLGESLQHGFWIFSHDSKTSPVGIVAIIRKRFGSPVDDCAAGHACADDGTNNGECAILYFRDPNANHVTVVEDVHTGAYFVHAVKQMPFPRRGS